MINESTLNDVFKFIELKPANILSPFPLTKTPEIIETQDESLEVKREKSEAFLTALNFDIKHLKYGELIIKNLDKLLNQDVQSTTHLNQSTIPKVLHFYEVAKSNYIDVESDTFKNDLNILSNLVYFTSYSSQKVLSKQNRNLYLAYQTLIKAHIQLSFRDTLLAFLFGRSNKPFIKSVGKEHLLVVKQHLLRYEETDVAHIENVMKGETRTREHRFLDRFEETLTFENERTIESEKEQENKERFEMNRETSKTIKEDHKFGAQLSVSGKLGPAVEFSSNLSYEYGLETETENKTASEYAKDIMDRSLERVNERVREERITKILKENETKNLHSFTNKTAEGPEAAEAVHFSGIYQFVDKVYRAQVFDYGLRQMFDLMIPEPASYLWHFNKYSEMQSGFTLKKPTFNLNNPFEIETTHVKYVISGRPDAINPLHYANLAKTYGATGIAPPPTTKVVTFSYVQPKAEETDAGNRDWAAENSGSTEGWQFYPPAVLDIDIPKKHLPIKVELNIQAYSDNRNSPYLFFNFDFGAKIHRLYNVSTDFFNSRYEGRANNLFECSDSFIINEDDRYKILSDQSKFKISYSSQDSANHTISIAITCEPSDELIQQWQLTTFDSLYLSYEDQLLDYESKLAQFNAEQKARENLTQDAYGVPPSKQKQVMLTEIKKHAISIFTDNATSKAPYDQNYSVNTNTTPPTIDRSKAKIQGEFIRFFEQAFEWAQMQYAFYPYFWSSYSRWEDKFRFDDPNYEFQQFMQAGSARVIVPVRLGYEEAVAHYLHTGEIWDGESPPQIGDPLYFSIINQIKERAGHSDKSPVPYGEPWEVRVPTSLIKLKADDELPKWQQIDGRLWEWEKNEDE